MRLLLFILYINSFDKHKLLFMANTNLTSAFNFPSWTSHNSLTSNHLLNKGLSSFVINKKHQTLNDLMRSVIQQTGPKQKQKFFLSSTDQIFHSLMLCAHSGCSAFILIGHDQKVNTSFKILNFSLTHEHSKVAPSDIQNSVRSTYSICQRIEFCKDIFEGCGVGNYFYNFLQSYKVIKGQYNGQRPQNCQAVPYMLPSISIQKIIPITFKVYKSKFQNQKRLDLNLIKSYIIAKQFSKLENLHYLTGSSEDNDLMIIIMVLAYSFLSDVKNFVIKTEKKLFELLKGIQLKKQHCSNSLSNYEKCICKLLKIYENFLNQQINWTIFQELTEDQLDDLKEQSKISEKSYQVFSKRTKDYGTSVNKIKKWNVLVNCIQKNRVKKIVKQLGRKPSKFDDSKFIEIKDEDFFNDQNDNDDYQNYGYKKIHIEKKQTSIIEDLIVGKYEAYQGNLELSELRQKLTKQQQEKANKIKQEVMEIENFIDLM